MTRRRERGAGEEGIISTGDGGGEAAGGLRRVAFPCLSRASIH